MNIYSKFNNFRKRKFRTMTFVSYDENDNRVAIKKAATKDAYKFVNSLDEKRKLLKKVNFSIEPTDVNVEDGIAKFNFVEGKSLDSLLIKAFNRRDEERFIKLIEGFIKIIKNNNLVKSGHSNEFKKIFRNSADGKNLEYLKLGVVDLNFDNIILRNAEENYSLIDYEWVFNFPIPYKFVIFRSVVSFYGKYRVYDLNKFVHIKKIYDIAKIEDEDKETFIEMELNFQNYVLRYAKDFKSYRKSILGLEEDCPNNDFLSHLNSVNVKMENLEKEIGIMKNYKFWKIINLYIKYKNKLFFLIFHPICFLKKYFKFF